MRPPEARVLRISASMAACRVMGSSRMWRMMADMWASSEGVKQALGSSSSSLGPLAAKTWCQPSCGF